MLPRETDVLIVGAGPTGLALAAADPAQRSAIPYTVTVVVCIAACVYGWSFGLLGA